MKVKFYELETIEEKKLMYSVVPSRYQGQWLYVRHKERTTWEVPGGHIEAGEHPDDAAKRELFEETGATDYEVKPLCDYTVEVDGSIGYGRIYLGTIRALGPLPDMEIGELMTLEALPDSMTYAGVLPAMFEEVKRRCNPEVPS